MKLVILALVAMIATAIGSPNIVFEVELHDFGAKGPLYCSVTFNGNLPPPARVDEILLQSLRLSTSINPERDVVAIASHGDDDLSSSQYSGKRTYKAATQQIMPIAEVR